MAPLYGNVDIDTPGPPVGAGVTHHTPPGSVRGSAVRGHEESGARTARFHTEHPSIQFEIVPRAARLARRVPRRAAVVAAGDGVDVAPLERGDALGDQSLGSGGQECPTTHCGGRALRGPP